MTCPTLDMALPWWQAMPWVYSNSFNLLWCHPPPSSPEHSWGSLELYFMLKPHSLFFGRPFGVGIHCTVQGWAKKFLLSSVTHVLSGLMGCALAALSWWVAWRREIQTCRNYFAPPCTSALRNSKSEMRVPVWICYVSCLIHGDFMAFEIEISRSRGPWSFCRARNPMLQPNQMQCSILGTLRIPKI